MWRYFAGGAAVIVAAIAAVFLFRGPLPSEAKVPPPPAAAAGEEEPLPEEAPSAPAKSREQKRFDRYDKNRDDTITREEYLASRRKAYAKLDVNGDGRLSFDEWAVRTTAKFAGADKDKSGGMNRTEFATTAPKRRAAPKCACPEKKQAPAPREEAEEGGEE